MTGSSQSPACPHTDPPYGPLPPVEEEVAGLLGDPRGAWMGGDAEHVDPAGGVPYDGEAVQPYVGSRPRFRLYRRDLAVSSGSRRFFVRIVSPFFRFPQLREVPPVALAAAAAHGQAAQLSPLPVAFTGECVSKDLSGRRETLSAARLTYCPTPSLPAACSTAPSRPGSPRRALRSRGMGFSAWPARPRPGSPDRSSPSTADSSWPDQSGRCLGFSVSPATPPVTVCP